jgi:hypothetical protein
MSKPSKAAAQLRDITERVRVVEVARRVAQTEGAVRHHVSGRRTPGPELRAAYAEAYGIAADGWDEPAAEPTAPRRGKKPVTATAKVATAVRRARGATARAQLENALDGFDALEGQSGDWAPRDRIALQTARVNAAAKLARFSGEDASDETRLLESPRFRQVLATVSKTLSAHPEASRAVEAALKEIGL